MLRSDLPSHRRSNDAALVQALGRREPLALAEACSRTLPVAHSIARRLLPAAEVDALLAAVYVRLWEDPPTGGALERWVRSTVWSVGLATLRERGAAPAAPSVRTVATGLPEPKITYLDSTERALAALDDEDRAVLLRAHDCGLPTADQGAAAGERLVRALARLADPDATGDDGTQPDGRLGDLVLGLLDPDEAAELDSAITADPVRTARLQVLRRGRRRIEGLPPTPDLGARVVAAVLSGLAGETPGSEPPGSGAAAVAMPPTATRSAEPAPSAMDEPLEPPPQPAPAAAPPPGGATAAAAGLPGAGSAAASQPEVSAPPAGADSEVSPAPPSTETAPAAAPHHADQRPASALDPQAPAAAPPLPSALRDLDDAPPERGPVAHGESTEDLTDATASLRGPGDDRPRPTADPYAELRGTVPSRRRRKASVDPDDPFADLREELGRPDAADEPASPWAASADWHDDEPPAPGNTDAGEHAAHAYDDDDDEPSGMGRIMQALLILVVVAVVIAGGLWAGQTLFRVLTG